MLNCHTTLQVQTLEGKTFAVIVEMRELNKTGKQLSNTAQCFPYVLDVKHVEKILLRDLRESENKYQAVKSLLINSMFLTVLC